MTALNLILDFDLFSTFAEKSAMLDIRIDPKGKAED